MVVVDGQGVQLGSQLVSASPGEVTLAESTLAQIAVPRGGRGRPQQRPLRVIADRAYDSDPLHPGDCCNAAFCSSVRIAGDGANPRSTTGALCAATAIVGRSSAPSPGWATSVDCSCAMIIKSPCTEPSSISLASSSPSATYETASRTLDFIMEPMAGIEPATDGLRNRCSTTELHWQARRRERPRKLWRVIFWLGYGRWQANSSGDGSKCRDFATGSSSKSCLISMRGKRTVRSHKQMICNGANHFFNGGCGKSLGERRTNRSDGGSDASAAGHDVSRGASERP